MAGNNPGFLGGQTEIAAGRSWNIPTLGWGMQQLVEFVRMDKSCQGREGAALGIWVQGIGVSARPLGPAGGYSGAPFPLGKRKSSSQKQKQTKKPRKAAKISWEGIWLWHPNLAVQEGWSGMGWDEGSSSVTTARAGSS